MVFINVYLYELDKWSRLLVSKDRRWGKSGLQRAGCQITSGGGDSQESATENTAGFRPGKGEKAV